MCQNLINVIYFMWEIVLDNSFSIFLLYSTLLGTEFFQLEPWKTSFLTFDTSCKYLISIQGQNFHFLKISFLWNFKNWYFYNVF